MDNRILVETVERDEYYLDFKSPRDERVLEAMRKVDRKHFIPHVETELYTVYPFFVNELALAHTMLRVGATSEDDGKKVEGLQTMVRASEMVIRSLKRVSLYSKALAYNNMALNIGHNQTCSQPSMVGFMNDVLELNKERMNVLEIGTGCGYHAAITSHMLEEKEGRLVTIECIPELAEMATSHLGTHFGDLERRIRVVCGDGSIGFKEEMPYDRIYLTAGISESFDPSILARQLGVEGIILFPEKQGDMIKQTYRDGEVVDEKRYEGVSFVPLQGENA